jgi:hypothetical protein
MEKGNCLRRTLTCCLSTGKVGILIADVDACMSRPSQPERSSRGLSPRWISDHARGCTTPLRLLRVSKRTAGATKRRCQRAKRRG